MKQLQMKQILSFILFLKILFHRKNRKKRKKEEIMCEIISISCSMTPSQPAPPWARPFIPFPIHLVSGHYTVTGPRRTGGAGETHQSAGDFNRISLDPFEVSTGGDLQTKLRAERAGQRRHCPSISAGNAFSYFSCLFFFVLSGCCCCCCLECCRRDGAIL